MVLTIKDINLLPYEYKKKIKDKRKLYNILILLLIFFGTTICSNIILKLLTTNNNKKIQAINLEIMDKKFDESDKISDGILSFNNNISLVNIAEEQITQDKYNLEKTILVILDSLKGKIFLEKMIFSKDENIILLQCVTDDNNYINEFIEILNLYNDFKKVSLTNFETKNKIYFTIEISLMEDEIQQENFYE